MAALACFVLLLGCHSAKPSSSILIGENNIGSVTLDGNKVTHVLLSRGEGTTAHLAEVYLSPAT